MDTDNVNPGYGNWIREKQPGHLDFDNKKGNREGLMIYHLFYCLRIADRGTSNVKP